MWFYDVTSWSYVNLDDPVTIRHPARPSRGVTKYQRHKLQASEWENCIVRGVRNGCTMEGSTPFCALCGISLPLSSKRRTLSSSVEANKEAVDFMLKSVVAVTPCDHDGNRFLSEYACRPCFAKLEKGSRHYKNTISLISELRVTARATASVEVAVNEPFPSPADSSA